MANGNDLAQAYSLLGQGMTAEYERRRREEEEYRKRARRDQLLGYLIAPIGQELAKGVSTAITTPFARASQKFFESEEGLNLARRQNSVKTLKSDWNTVNKEVVKGGGARYMADQLRSQAIENLNRQYQSEMPGIDFKSSAVYAQDLIELEKEVQEKAEIEYEQHVNLGKRLKTIKSDARQQEIVKRYNPYPNNIFSAGAGLFSKVFGGKPIEDRRAAALRSIERETGLTAEFIADLEKEGKLGLEISYDGILKGLDERASTAAGSDELRARVKYQKEVNEYRSFIHEGGGTPVERDIYYKLSRTGKNPSRQDVNAELNDRAGNMFKGLNLSEQSADRLLSGLKTSEVVNSVILDYKQQRADELMEEKGTPFDSLNQQQQSTINREVATFLKSSLEASRSSVLRDLNNPESQLYSELKGFTSVEQIQANVEEEIRKRTMFLASNAEVRTNILDNAKGVGFLGLGPRTSSALVTTINQGYAESPFSKRSVSEQPTPMRSLGQMSVEDFPAEEFSAVILQDVGAAKTASQQQQIIQSMLINLDAISGGSSDEYVARLSPEAQQVLSTVTPISESESVQKPKLRLRDDDDEYILSDEEVSKLFSDLTIGGSTGLDSDIDRIRTERNVELLRLGGGLYDSVMNPRLAQQRIAKESIPKVLKRIELYEQQGRAIPASLTQRLEDLQEKAKPVSTIQLTDRERDKIERRISFINNRDEERVEFLTNQIEVLENRIQTRPMSVTEEIFAKLAGYKKELSLRPAGSAEKDKLLELLRLDQQEQGVQATSPLEPIPLEETDEILSRPPTTAQKMDSLLADIGVDERDLEPTPRTSFESSPSSFVAGVERRTNRLDVPNVSTKAGRGIVSKMKQEVKDQLGIELSRKETKQVITSLIEPTEENIETVSKVIAKKDTTKTVEPVEAKVDSLVNILENIAPTKKADPSLLSDAESLDIDRQIARELADDIKNVRGFSGMNRKTIEERIANMNVSSSIKDLALNFIFNR